MEHRLPVASSGNHDNEYASCWKIIMELASIDYVKEKIQL